MAGIIHEMTGTIISSVIQQLPQLRRENPMEVSSILEEEEETYTHTPLVWKGNEPTTGQQSHHEATTQEAAASAPPPDAVAALQRQVEDLSARVGG
ncbi:hypothetical protein LIER_43291 [Lithospermum erythrorhizon]|uniref:Uncharacterized protein n=1 Tax=Lithospermum erythrorhizon TaxID=34254 RepID=A0AAV3PXV3_LITER